MATQQEIQVLLEQVKVVTAGESECRELLALIRDEPGSKEVLSWMNQYYENQNLKFELSKWSEPFWIKLKTNLERYPDAVSHFLARKDTEQIFPGSFRRPVQIQEHIGIKHE